MSNLHPNNCLWSVDQNGIIIFYNLESKKFEILPSDQDLLFKCVASCKNSLWAVTCDHRLFLYVFSSSNHKKIVQNFIIYENQRWMPLKGFSNNLLPTDRPNFSNKEGTKELSKDSFELPSSNWQWKDHDWQIDEWQYAADFSLDDKYFTKDKTMLSMVRKRKYTRTAYYSKLDEWVEIDSMFKDKYEDPILDVGIGGQDAIRDLNTVHRLNEQQQIKSASFAVWVVTISGRLYFKKSFMNDLEGSEFVEVSTSEILNSNLSSSDDEEEDKNAKENFKIEEITKVAINYYGSVWCLTTCGRCLTRLGITKDNLMGTSWYLVESPFNAELGQISVGNDSVWAVCCKTNEVFFRKGIRSMHAGSNLNCLVGSAWISLPETSKMSYLSVNQFDQCFALSVDKKSLYFRIGCEVGK